MLLPKASQRQRLGDKWFHTIVVKGASLTGSQIPSAGRIIAAQVMGLFAYSAFALLTYVYRLQS
jgi:hypothetical protein